MNIRGLGCTHEGRPNQSWRREHGNKKLDLLSVLRWLQTLAVVCHVGKTTSLTYACCQTIATCCRWICLWLQCVNPALTSILIVGAWYVFIYVLQNLLQWKGEHYSLQVLSVQSLEIFLHCMCRCKNAAQWTQGGEFEFWKNYLERKIGVAIEQ